MFVLFIGTMVHLFKGWIGFLGYLVGVLAGIIGIPLIVIYPWFSAWVDSSPVLTADLVLWATHYCTLIAACVLRLTSALIDISTDQNE